MKQPVRSPKDVEGQSRRSGWCFATRKDLDRIERLIMITAAELEAGLKKLQTQAANIATEQATRFDAAQAKIAELEALIAGGGQITPELVNAYDALVVAMQSLDDVIPNAP